MAEHESDFVNALLRQAFPSAACTADINSKGVDVYSRFHHDSVLSEDFPTPNHKTVVRTLFGSDDLGPAVPLGTEWYNAVTSTKSGACIAGAPHELPSNYDGATTIINDVSTLCK